MDAEEDRLRFAVLATAPAGGLHFPLEATHRAIADIPGIGDDNFSVRRFAPESFLVLFGGQRARDRALDASSVSVEGARLFFRPWTRLVRATREEMRFRVSVEIEGVPTHAWSLRTARKVLASSYWIERLEPSSEDRSDMSRLALTAWTNKPSRIPKEKTVYIAEHEPPVIHGDPDVQRIFANVRLYLRQKVVLKYDTIIHVRGIADFRSRSPSPGPSPHPTTGTHGRMVTPIAVMGSLATMADRACTVSSAT
ncbi:unnamed protein product [Urochloa humidicola]